MIRRFFTRKYILIICIPIVLCLVYILLVMNTDNSIDFSDEIDNATLAYMDTHRNSENLSEDERLSLLNKNVISKYPNSDVSVGIKLEMYKRDYDSSKVYGLTMDQYNQMLYRRQKELIKHHPNSAKLLLHLSELGFRSYPEEVILYCKKVIMMHPNKVDAYLIAANAYQVMGNFDLSLSVLEDGKQQVLNRLTRELNRQYPYAPAKNLPAYYAHDINNAKAYLRGLGYKVGSDVDYDLDDIIQKTRSLIIGSRAAYMLSSGTMTPIADMYYLDRIMTGIDAIKSNNPIWTPNSRVPIIDDISKNTDR